MISLRAEDEETIEFVDLSIFYELSRVKVCLPVIVTIVVIAINLDLFLLL